MLKAVLLSLCVFGAEPKFDELFLGVSVVDVEDAKERLSTKDVKFPSDAKGCVVVDVVEHSPVHGNLNKMSIIQKIGKKPIRSIEDFNAAKAELKPGEKVALEGLGASISQKSGRMIWAKRGRSTITPVVYRDFLEEAAEKKYDEFTKQEWIRHRSEPGIGGTDVTLYFQQTDYGAANLRLRMTYSGDDWIFINKLTFRSGDQVASINIDRKDLETKVVTGGVWEWIDVPLPADVCRVLLLASETMDCGVRREGDQTHQDQKLSIEEIWRVRTILDLFVARKGELPK